MIDTHAHTDFKEFDNDREEVLKRFFKNGGYRIVSLNPGSQARINRLAHLLDFSRNP